MVIMEWNKYVNTDFALDGDYGYKSDQLDVLSFESGRERRTLKNNWVSGDFPAISLVLDNVQSIAPGSNDTEFKQFKVWYEITLRYGTLPFYAPNMSDKSKEAVYEFIPDSLHFNDTDGIITAMFGLREVGNLEYDAIYVRDVQVWIAATSTRSPPPLANTSLWHETPSNGFVDYDGFNEESRYLWKKTRFYIATPNGEDLREFVTLAAVYGRTGFVELNLRGMWDSTVTDYSLNDVVTFVNPETGAMNTYVYTERISGSTVPPYENGSPWMLLVMQGETGFTPDIQIGDVVTVDPDKPATVTRRNGSTNEDPIFDFEIPRGFVPDIQVGEVATGAPYELASVTRQYGSPDEAPVLDFVLPRGDTGFTPQITATAEVVPNGSQAGAEVTGAAENPNIHFTIPKGDTGLTPQIDATVETGLPGSQAEIEISGTAEEPVLHFTIPRGDTGSVDNVGGSGLIPVREASDLDNLEVGNIILALDDIESGTWTAPSSGITTSLRSITFGNGMFVAVGDIHAMGNGGRVVTSPDGIEWTIRDSGFHSPLNSITFGNGLFVIATGMGSQGGSGGILTSPDGITWTAIEVFNVLNSITFGNGMFVAVGDGGGIRTSPDGITWTAPSSGITTSLHSVTFGNGMFVIVGDAGIILTSTLSSSPPFSLSKGDLSKISSTDPLELEFLINVSGGETDGELITTDMIADEAVTREKIADNAINSAKIENGSVSQLKLNTNVFANLTSQTANFGQGVQHGSATTAARSDHRHPLPNFPIQSQSNVPPPVGGYCILRDALGEAGGNAMFIGDTVQLWQRTAATGVVVGNTVVQHEYALRTNPTASAPSGFTAVAGTYVITSRFTSRSGVCAQSFSAMAQRIA